MSQRVCYRRHFGTAKGDLCMSQKASFEKWAYEGDKVRLDYSDGDSVYIARENLKRALMCVGSLTKEEVIRDFGIKENNGTE